MLCARTPGIAIETHDILTLRQNCRMTGMQGRLVLKDVRDGQRHPNGNAQPTLARNVFARTVQQAFAEQEELAGLQFHIDGLLDIKELGIRHVLEGHALFCGNMRYRAAMRTRYDLHTGIVDRDLVNSDPGGNIDRRFQRPEIDILVPGDLGAARRLQPEIGRPCHQIRSQQAGNAFDDSRMRRQIVEQRGSPCVGIARAIVDWDRRS